MCDELTTIKKVPKTMKNCRIFRTIARDICGESMEPSETDTMYFGYHQKGKHQPLFYLLSYFLLLLHL